MLLRNGMLWLAGNQTMQRTVVRSRLARPMARRFVAGEELQEALEVAATLNRRGALATLDYLGENVTSEEEARHVVHTYTDLLRAIRTRGLACNVSLKLTALGLDIGRDVCVENLDEIARVAREQGNFVRIDMEGSDYTATTLAIFEELRCSRGYHNVGIVLQSALYRTAGDVERAITLGARVRLCKGAYLERPEVAFPEKADVDLNYVALARRLVCDGHYPALATHDGRIIEWVKRFAEAERIGRERFEFQMLYGVRRDLQHQLIDEGYDVRVYVPFGESWYPYLMRRLAERPANLFFILRALQHR